MKYRMSFVTNSSSSSFVCDVCGSVESGYDASLSDFDMSRCVNGHEFCDHHAKGLKVDKKEELLELLEQRIKYQTNSKYYTDADVLETAQVKQKVESGELYNGEIEELYREYSDGDVPVGECPICSMNSIKDDEFTEFLLKKFNVIGTDMTKEIRDTFKSYLEFKEYLSK